MSNHAVVDRSSASPTRYHADFTLKVMCGCGARFQSVDEGLQHAEATGHTSHISGEIRVQK